MDVRAQVSQMSQERREALAQRIRSRLSHADSPATDHDVSIVGRRRLGTDVGPGDSPSASYHANPGYRAERPSGARDHPHGRRVDGRGFGALLARPARIGRPLAGLSASQDGPADVLLERRETPISRNGVELGSSSFVPQVTYQIDRGRLENELTPTLHGRRRRYRPRPSASVEFGTASLPHTISVQNGEAVTRPRHGGWSTRRAGTGCCRGSWISSAPTSITAMPRGFASRRKSISVDGAMTRAGRRASSRATVRCPPII